MDSQSQNHYLYRLLVSGQSITSLDAMLHHHIGRLASRICDLTEKYFVPVIKEWEPNSDGIGRHMRYSMSAEDRERLQDVDLYSVVNVIYPNFKKKDA